MDSPTSYAAGIEAAARPLRFCGYCKMWNAKPCGPGCVWEPTMPTLQQLEAALAPERGGGSGDERDAFETWAASDHRDLAAEMYEERTPDNGLYYQTDSTNHCYIGWRARAALATAPPAAPSGWRGLKPGDRVLVHAIVAEVHNFPTNWPIRIVLDKGENETIDCTGSVHFSALAAAPPPPVPAQRAEWRIGAEAAAQVCEAYGNDQMALVIRNDLGSALAPERGGGSEDRPSSEQVQAWIRRAYREPEDRSQVDASRFTRWNMEVAYFAGFEAAAPPPPVPAQAASGDVDPRKCTCHPDEAPVPCQREYALTHCKLKAAKAKCRELEGEVAQRDERIAVMLKHWQEEGDRLIDTQAALARLTTAAQAARDALRACDERLKDMGLAKDGSARAIISAALASLASVLEGGEG